MIYKKFKNSSPGVLDFVLVVEKETLFYRLIDEKVFEKYKCVVITAHGYPDFPTRLFLRKLYEWLKNPTGDNNTGDNNTGDNDTGDNNTGDNNVGDNNTGDNNTGDNDTGDNNTGDNNTGDNNTGDNNTGDNNIGDNNTGDNNTGDNDTGDDHEAADTTQVPFLVLCDADSDGFSIAANYTFASKSSKWFCPADLTVPVLKLLTPTASDATKRYGLFESEKRKLSTRSRRRLNLLRQRLMSLECPSIEQWRSRIRSVLDEGIAYEADALQNLMALIQDNL
eukprot:CAMPEP_0113856304 /NCGR_PEP_ID=MMETSP0372-20130328/9087_1 /TAXON_ID=340204 /ORGANISM="Lankesteria abbotti" /LENGTH=279 /DNA_ID=CAMNT_0000831141 /DNA_START=395 /DNA_END=1234 /DNA_ORIENTATION=+ /assembly_acc=CAM_ASM_000359